MKTIREKLIRAWDGVIEWPLPGRLQKPRTTGLTMVIDKGLGLSATLDLLELGAPYIDFIKLAFGTSAFYSPTLLRKKIDLIKAFGVEPYPGGTFLEVALIQGRLAHYLAQATDLGFRFVEVSDGTIALAPAERNEAIAQAVAQGLRVITEVGKKDPDNQPEPLALREQIVADLAAGAERVIVEGRETGKGVGVYDQAGHIKSAHLDLLVSGLPDAQAQVLIWEAPEKVQQQELILRFGPNVSLGNIPPAEVIALEALRCGMRSDTLKSAVPTAASHGEGD